MIKCYDVPCGLPIPCKVLLHMGKFYSFGCTPRSFQGIWNEVKGGLDMLETFELNECELEELEYCLVEILEED